MFEPPFPSIARALSILLAAAGLLLGGAAATAQDRACHDDVQKLCANVPRGGGAIARCLQEHQAELSPACRDSLAQHKEKARSRADAVHDACSAEIKQYCADVKPGGGGVVHCLRRHEVDLSQPCRDALPKPRR